MPCGGPTHPIERPATWTGLFFCPPPKAPAPAPADGNRNDSHRRCRTNGLTNRLAD
jgi:hypothetical protein